MRKNNPFSIFFGREPYQVVTRGASENEVYENFDADTPSTQVFLITGVRGYGKTVLLTSVAHHYRSEADWLVFNLNPERDLLLQLASHLYESDALNKYMMGAKINLTAFGIGVALENAAPISDVEIAIGKMLALAKKHGKKILITIDEVTNSDYIRVFASAFQIMIREDYPVFLLMTGLYENIKDLKNDRSLTFLYRAPNIELKPLSVASMQIKYKNVFECSDEEALQMAQLTKGYPYAFQVLGYLKWNNEGASLVDLLPEFDVYLEDRAYDKIWSELSSKDKDVLSLIAANDKASTAQIIEGTGLTQSSYSTYRKRLLDKGLIDTSEYGYASLTLPRFDVFIKNRELI